MDDLLYHARRWQRSNDYAKYDIVSNIIKEYSSYEAFFKSDNEETHVDLPCISGSSSLRVSIHEVYIFIFVMCLF